MKKILMFNRIFTFGKDQLRTVRSFLHKSVIYRAIYRLSYLKTPLFDHILIQTNNRCTRKCAFCWHGIKDVNTPDEEMPQWLFYRIIDTLAAIDYSGRVSLFGMNEPLIDPRIFEWIKYVKQKIPRSWQMLVTNGDLLTEDKIVKLFEDGLDYLNISSYNDDSFFKVKSMISRVPKQFSGNIVNQRLAIEDMSDNRGGNLPIIETLQEPLKEPCSRVYHVLYVKPDGSVVSCCGDYFNLNLLGNAKERNLLDIWFDAQFERLRKQLNRGDRTVSKLCRECNIGAGTYFVTRAKQKEWARKGRLKGGSIY